MRFVLLVSSEVLMEKPYALHRLLALLILVALAWAWWHFNAPRQWVVIRSPAPYKKGYAAAYICRGRLVVVRAGLTYEAAAAIVENQ